MLKWKVFLFSLCVFPSAGGGGGGRAREAAAGRARDAPGAGVAGGQGTAARRAGEEQGGRALGTERVWSWRSWERGEEGLSVPGGRGPGVTM